MTGGGLLLFPPSVDLRGLLAIFRRKLPKMHVSENNETFKDWSEEIYEVVVEVVFMEGVVTLFDSMTLESWKRTMTQVTF